MKSAIESLYLDYFNNFLSVDYFAEYYGITIEKARRILYIGRKLNHRRPSPAYYERDRLNSSRK